MRNGRRTYFQTEFDLDGLVGLDVAADARCHLLVDDMQFKGHHSVVDQAITADYPKGSS